MTSSRANASADRGVVRVVLAAQVLSPLVDVAESTEVPHAVEEDDAVQVVELVLDDAGLEAADRIVDGAPLPVETLHADSRVARYDAAQVRDREASFPVVDQLPLLRRD